MPHFSCYLPETLLQRLDEQVKKTPRGNRSGIMREALEQLLDSQPTTVREVFDQAIKHYDSHEEHVRANTEAFNRADAFRRATQR